MVTPEGGILCRKKLPYAKPLQKAPPLQPRRSNFVEVVVTFWWTWHSNKNRIPQRSVATSVLLLTPMRWHSSDNDKGDLLTFMYAGNQGYHSWKKVRLLEWPFFQALPSF